MGAWGQQALYLRETLKDFGYQQNTATEIYEDMSSMMTCVNPDNTATEIYEDMSGNLTCVTMSENLVYRKFSRRIDIRRYFVRQSVKGGFVELIPLRTHRMVADALTKSLPSPAFIGHRRVMMGQTPFALKFFHS